MCRIPTLIGECGLQGHSDARSSRARPSIVLILVYGDDVYGVKALDSVLDISSVWTEAEGAEADFRTAGYGHGASIELKRSIWQLRGRLSGAPFHLLDLDVHFLRVGEQLLCLRQVSRVPRLGAFAQQILQARRHLHMTHDKFVRPIRWRRQRSLPIHFHILSRNLIQPWALKPLYGAAS